MKKTINKKLVESLKKINQKEKDFRFSVNITPDLSLTFGLITAQQDILSQRYAKAVAPENKEEYEEAYATECFLWGIRAVNGEEVDQSSVVETDRVDAQGKSELVEFHKYLRDEIISNWSRETLNNIRGIVSIKTADWSVQSTREIKTSDGLSILDLMKNLTEAVTKPVSETSVPSSQEAAPVSRIAPEPDPNTPPPKRQKPLDEETYQEGGALDDPYKTGAASPTTLEEVKDKLVAQQDEETLAKFSQISKMEGLDFPPNRIAPEGFQVGDTIAPYSGPEGVGVGVPSVQERREAQKGLISSRSELMDANAIEKYKKERQRGR